MDIKTHLLDILFPLSCFGCHLEGSFLCASCREKMEFIPPKCFGCGKLVYEGARTPSGRTCSGCRNKEKTEIYAFFSPFSYENELARDLIHALKYSRIQPLAEILANILRDYLTNHQVKFPENLIIIPIPLHKSRERTRGFNQSRIIAEKLGKLLKMEVKNDILIKNKSTKPQIELSAEKRKKNLADVFKVVAEKEKIPKNIIILDDVKTTGTTLEEAAKTLKAAGTERIYVLTVAHT